MSEKTVGQLRDEATTTAIELAEYQRKAERLQGMLDEKMATLVQVTIERDEARRELSQVQGAERAVRRRVLQAGFNGDAFVAVADLRQDLDTRNPSEA